MAIRFKAPAKINLCLHVLGQRPNGFHILDSLVAFLDCGEWIELRKASKTTLQIIGPQSEKLPLGADNLVLRAADIFPAGCTTEILLHKTMPISSGIGGGSSNAAATLRGMSELWNIPSPDIVAQLSLGSDVPVCMWSKPVVMQGTGEVISELSYMPPLFACLVNPARAVSTAIVFNQLESKSNSAMGVVPTCPLIFLDWLVQQRNDLQAPAVDVEPMIVSVLSELKAHNPKVSRMSGSGATCFALFETLEAATSCAQVINETQPSWWTASGPLIVS